MEVAAYTPKEGPVESKAASLAGFPKGIKGTRDGSRNSQDVGLKTEGIID